MSKIIGIDLGSTNSAVSFFEGNDAQIIPNSEGGRTTPSIVAFTKNGERLVGQAAQRQMITNASNTITIVKRLIGRKFAEVQDYIKSLPYEVVAAPNGDCRIKVMDKEYSPEEVSSFILAKLKADAEAFLGEKVTSAVITVPAYFNDSQRQATKNAGQIAGLEVERVVNEPTSASLAYSLGKGYSKKVAVFDLGGSTFDISIVDISDGVVEVLATNGNVSLGGHDIDVALMDYVISEFKKESGIDISNDTMAMQRVKDECEKAKCAMSTSTTYEMSLPFITADATGPKHLSLSLNRARLDEISRDIINKTIEPCKKCLEDAGNPKLDEVLLVGGQTRMPLVVETVKSIFGIEPNKNINPDEAVSIGAAIQAGVLKGETKDLLLLDVTPLTLSICTNGQLATEMIARNSTIPCKKTQTFTNAAPMQNMATILVGQGERKMFSDNKLLGQFNVEITPCPVQGQAQIEVSYDIDSNGILTVSAKDLALNKVANITITNSSGLSKEEIEKAKMEAEKYAEEDAKRVELVNTKNSAESLCDQIERAMKDAGDKLTEDDKKPVDEAIVKVREVIKSDNIDEIKTALESLNNVWGTIVTKIYPQQTAPNGQQFSAEDMEKMKNNPDFMNQFSQMFGGQTPTGGATSTTDADEAEVVS
jgi:molecular chaperone DnaK